MIVTPNAKQPKIITYNGLQYFFLPKQPHFVLHENGKHPEKTLKTGLSLMQKRQTLMIFLQPTQYCEMLKTRDNDTNQHKGWLFFPIHPTIHHAHKQSRHTGSAAA